MSVGDPCNARLLLCHTLSRDIFVDTLTNDVAAHIRSHLLTSAHTRLTIRLLPVSRVVGREVARFNRHFDSATDVNTAAVNAAAGGTSLSHAMRARSPPARRPHW